MQKQVSQNINDAVVGNMAGGVVHVDNRTTVNNHHTHHHQHTLHAHGPLHVHTHVEMPEFSLQAPPAPPARKGRGGKLLTREVTAQQREALALMRPLPKPMRVDVLIWMRTEFGTSLVMDLDPRELLRLRTHLGGVRLGVGDRL